MCWTGKWRAFGSLGLGFRHLGLGRGCGKSSFLRDQRILLWEDRWLLYKNLRSKWAFLLKSYIRNGCLCFRGALRFRFSPRFASFRLLLLVNSRM